MGLLVRKISRAKWNSALELEPSGISADAVTVDLRTSGNKLSFWEFDESSGDDELSRIATALAGGFQKLDILDVAWVSRSLIESSGIRLEKTEGNTPVRDVKSFHLDAVDLDLTRIERLSRILAHAIQTDNNYKRFSRQDVRTLLQQAVRECRLSPDDLSDQLRKDVAADTGGSP